MHNASIADFAESCVRIGISREIAEKNFICSEEVSVHLKKNIPMTTKL